MQVELDRSALREGETMKYTSGKKDMSLDTLFEDFARIFSPQDPDSLPDLRSRSNCCSALLLPESDICSNCGEHCEAVNGE
jgi:hypothetical protein